jgi:hypothetical protein
MALSLFLSVSLCLPLEAAAVDFPLATGNRFQKKNRFKKKHTTPCRDTEAFYHFRPKLTKVLGVRLS